MRFFSIESLPITTMTNNSDAGPVPQGETSPWYTIQPRQIVTVEHPCLIKNFHAGIQTLGGSSEVDQMVKEKGKNPISLFLSPCDPASRPLISTNRMASNVLLKITVPQRTGRKRKRGSDQPWMEDRSQEPPRKDAKYLLRSLRDKPGNFSVEIPGTVVASQVFRTMPDFVYSTSDSTFMTQIRETILPFQYSLMKGWKLDMSRGKTNGEIIPPPTLSTQQVPGNYGYRQNPAVQEATDERTGKRVMINVQKGPPIYTIQVNRDSLTIPRAPDSAAPPLSSQSDDFRGVVRVLEDIFSQRPIWTRRGMLNKLPPGTPTSVVKQAVGYVAYAIRSGPWRDCYVKLGIDPTTDPTYRVYQSVMLQLTNRSRENPSQPLRPTGGDRLNPNSHVFSGHLPVYDDGKAWQLCDLIDPILSKLVQTPDLRPSCERRYFGWYKNGTYSKIKIILKAKMDMLLAGEELGDTIFEGLVKFPEEFRGDDPEDPMAHLPADAGRQELLWASKYRAMCRAAEGTVPASGRLTKSRPTRRVGYLEPGEKDHDPGIEFEDVATASPERHQHDMCTPLPELDDEVDGEGDDESHSDDLAADLDGAREDEEVEEAGAVLGDGGGEMEQSETDDMEEGSEDSGEEAGE